MERWRLTLASCNLENNEFLSALRCSKGAESFFKYMYTFHLYQTLVLTGKDMGVTSLLFFVTLKKIHAMKEVGDDDEQANS